MLTPDRFNNVMMFLLTSICSIGLWIFSDFDTSLKKIEISIDTLNVQIARILEREETQEKANEYFTKRIRDLERDTQDRWSREDHKDYAQLQAEKLDNVLHSLEMRFKKIEDKVFK